MATRHICDRCKKRFASFELARLYKFSFLGSLFPYLTVELCEECELEVEDFIFGFKGVE